MSLSVRIREQSSNEQKVWGRLDTRYEVSRTESQLFDISEEIGRIPVQSHDSHFDQWVLICWPYLEDHRKVVLDKEYIPQNIVMSFPTLVESNGLNGNLLASSSVITWIFRVQEGKLRLSMASNRSRLA